MVGVTHKFVIFVTKLSFSRSIINPLIGNSLDKLRHPRSDAYSAEQVLLNKQQIWCGGAYPDCYLLIN